MFKLIVILVIAAYTCNCFVLYCVVLLASSTGCQCCAYFTLSMLCVFHAVVFHTVNAVRISRMEAWVWSSVIMCNTHAFSIPIPCSQDPALHLNVLYYSSTCTMRASIRKRVLPVAGAGAMRAHATTTPTSSSTDLFFLPSQEPG